MGRIAFWIGVVVMALLTLSSWWTTRKARHIMKGSLHRQIRPGEEASIGSWMKVPREDLEVASSELARDPFNSMLEKLLSFLGDQGLRSERYYPGTQDGVDALTPAGGSRQAYSRYLRAFGFVALGIALSLGTVWLFLRRDENWIRCQDKDPDVRIAGCTAVIQSGQNTPNQGEAFYSRGTAYAEKDDADRAIHDYDEALRLKPDFAAAFYYRGQMYAQKKNDVDRARQDFDRAININPGMYQAFLQRGMGHLAKADTDRAINDFDEAIRLNPAYSLAFHDRGVAYWLKGDGDHAFQDFDSAIKLDSTSSQSYYHRGLVLADRGDHVRALHDFNETIRLIPTHLLAIMFRAISHLKIGQFDEAILGWEMLQKLDPSLESLMLYGRGMTKRLKGDTVDGDRDIAAAEAMDPNVVERFARLRMKL